MQIKRKNITLDGMEGVEYLLEAPQGFVRVEVIEKGTFVHPTVLSASRASLQTMRELTIEFTKRILDEYGDNGCYIVTNNPKLIKWFKVPNIQHIKDDLGYGIYFVPREGY